MTVMQRQTEFVDDFVNNLTVSLHLAQNIVRAHSVAH